MDRNGGARWHASRSARSPDARVRLQPGGRRVSEIPKRAMKSDRILGARYSLNSASRHADLAYYMKDDADRRWHVAETIKQMNLAADELGFQLVPNAEDAE
jgi:hypothetical protein